MTSTAIADVQVETWRQRSLNLNRGLYAAEPLIELDNAIEDRPIGGKESACWRTPWVSR